MPYSSNPSGRTCNTKLVLFVLCFGLSLFLRMETATQSEVPDFVRTANPLDLGIVGKGYFTFTDGTEMLFTRFGRMHLNQENFLATRIGDKDCALIPMIEIPKDSTQVLVSRDGTVSVLRKGDAFLVHLGQIQLVELKPEEILQKTASGLTDKAIHIRVDTSHPAENGFGSLKQNYLEARPMTAYRLQPRKIASRSSHFNDVNTLAVLQD